MKKDSYESPWLRVFDLRGNKAILAVSSGDIKDTGLDNYDGESLDD